MIQPPTIDGWIKLSAVDKPVKQLQVERASSALADVDTAGWTLRFDLLSDPNRLEILLCLHRRFGCFGSRAGSVRPGPAERSVTASRTRSCTSSCTGSAPSTAESRFQRRRRCAFKEPK